jgi:nucleoside 2-deoxyribosyltransferase
MFKIYVAGPYSADNVIDVLKNIGRGEKACADLFWLGFYPFCPWHDKSYVTDNHNCDFTIDQFYKFSIAWLLVSDAVLLVGDWQKSKGTVAEVEVARENGIPVFKNINEVIEWSKTKRPPTSQSSTE